MVSGALRSIDRCIKVAQTSFNTATLYHVTAMLWYHIKAQLLLKKIRSFCDVKVTVATEKP